MATQPFTEDVYLNRRPRRISPAILASIGEGFTPSSAVQPAYALTSANCPAVQEGISSTLLTLANAAVGDGNAPSGRSMTRRVDWRQSVYNVNQLASELMGRYGGGGAYFVAKGLTLYNAGGLSLGVTAGHAIASAPIEYAGGTLAIPDTPSGTPTRYWIWISQAGAVTYGNPNSIAPPAGQQVLLGSCLTSGGTIIAIDTSGVLYAKGNRLVRLIADTTLPTDVPSSLVRYVSRNPWTFQEWEWTGGEHIVIPSDANPLPVSAGGSTGSGAASVTRVTTNYSVLSTDQFLIVDATAANLTITLPASTSFDHDLWLLRIDGSGHSAAIATTGGESVNDGTSPVAIMLVRGATVHLLSDGAHTIWWEL